MKWLLSFLAVAVLAHCNSAADDEVAASIPGTYARTSEHEFGREWDTLAVSVQNASAYQYKLVRRWRYERILDGKLLEPEYKITTTTAVYYAAGKTLQETNTGKRLSFEPKTATLFSGSNKYEKLK
jgi:hypothetical protein